jgi:20S proteasome alpha/beta subunit
VWATDSSGNYLSSIFGTVPGSSLALESLEPSFHQDLNGDGTIGPVMTVIEALGSTKLVQVANTYSLDPVGGSSGPQLRFSGASVLTGEFGAWAPIGAEQTASGYEVAWKVTGADQYQVWATDSSGNYLSSIFGTVPGSSLALESFEPSFHQDLNGDGTIGPVTTVIESFGSTSLIQASNTYFLYPVGGSSGPQLRYLGAPVLTGEFGAWAPIGAEQTASGYEVAWKVTGADQYQVWSTDSSGNYLSSIFGTVPGSSLALESFEPSFHQDLNGDGTIGPVTTVIEALGSTSLVQVANTYSLYPVGGSSGPQLRYSGAPVLTGEFGAWAPIGAEQTAGGYEVAWKVTGADQYQVWSTDSSGNYLSSIIGTVPGSSLALESLEPSFHQDLNGDGVIGSTTPMMSSYGSTGETGTGSSGTANLALLTNYLASTFVTPAGEGTGGVVASQSSAQDFLTKPIA